MKFSNCTHAHVLKSVSLSPSPPPPPPPLWCVLCGRRLRVSLLWRPGAELGDPPAVLMHCVWAALALPAKSSTHSPHFYFFICARPPGLNRSRSPRCCRGYRFVYKQSVRWFSIAFFLFSAFIIIRGYLEIHMMFPIMGCVDAHFPLLC